MAAKMTSSLLHHPIITMENNVLNQKIFSAKTSFEAPGAYAQSFSHWSVYLYNQNVTRTVSARDLKCGTFMRTFGQKYVTRCCLLRRNGESFKRKEQHLQWSADQSNVSFQNFKGKLYESMRAYFSDLIRTDIYLSLTFPWK